MCARSKCDGVRDAGEVKNLRRQRRQAMLQLKAQGPVEEVLGPKQDMIALATAQYRVLTILTGNFIVDVQESKLYKILVGSTQPAHLVTVIAVLTIATLVMPHAHSVEETQTFEGPHGSPHMYLIYLVAFTMHYGAQMWMTFISGLTLYFALPRHTFGGVQQVLFPKYFTLNSFLSLVTLIVFVKIHQGTNWDGQVLTQVCTMIVCFLLELVIRLYLTPPLLQLMAAKNAIEKAAGVGLEVGCHSVGSLNQCPHYMKLHKAFRAVHMTVAMGNMLAMGCTTYHLYYLSNKICLT